MTTEKLNPVITCVPNVMEKQDSAQVLIWAFRFTIMVYVTLLMYHARLKPQRTELFYTFKRMYIICCSVYFD